MLVLTRKIGEQILIGDDIVVTVLDSRGEGIRIGIDAPRGVKIQREEVLRAVIEANLAAAQPDPEAEARIKALLGMPTTPAKPADPANPVAAEPPAPAAPAKPADPA
ncbi:carbon storage regulator [Arthrobacter sp. H20]|uniref:carbon storage regulator n=1 Tax=Arthrobacter sp. H20 TaxID=1267981 RepID=UPI0004BBF7C9|nr:carbon storage regulator [Arthrobacter sp. H20]